MSKKFDVVVIGAGPGGYVAAIRASQLGKKVAIIEREKLGGVCLNKGCIPTKAVLKSAHSVQELKHFADLGINVKLESLDGAKALDRAHQVSDKISKGVGFLMKKNNIEVFTGEAVIKTKTSVVVGKETLDFTHLIIATGAHYRTFEGLVHDGKRLIGAWDAILMNEVPKSVGIIGAGAIGVEFAYFWKSFGADVTIYEMQNHLLPIEDEESSIEVEKAYKKMGINLCLGVKNVTAKASGKKAVIEYTDAKGSQKNEFDYALIAVGMTGNIQGFGLEEIGIQTEKGFVKVNEFGQTNISHIYAIGDVSGPPLLAHAASHEGVIAAEHLAGLKPHALDKNNIPGCTYCQPQVASVGYTEAQLKKENIKYSVGKLPFTANGKAVASFETDGFVKVLMGEHGEMLGAHIVGTHATELIHEYTLFRAMEGIDEEIFATVHPHPTLGEWLSEAVLASKKRALNF